MAGMTDYCDFSTHRKLGASSKSLGTDVLVRLPGGRLVVIDADVPVTSYLEAFETPDESVRDARLGDHAVAVRDHLASLGDRTYWSQFEIEPEFVFMFLPGEGFLSAAVQHDPSLLEFGISRGVIPASPLTLIALLRAVATGWRQDRLAQDAAAIRALGRELHGRVRELTEQWGEVARGLSQTVTAYNRAVGGLEHRVLTPLRRLSDHGGAAPEPVPQLEPVETAVRAFHAPELVSSRVTTMRIRHASLDGE
jgi:DNA recombination protein RmuC